jgi:hypothetical protein
VSATITFNLPSAIIPAIASRAAWSGSTSIHLAVTPASSRRSWEGISGPLPDVGYVTCRKMPRNAASTSRMSAECDRLLPCAASSVRTLFERQLPGPIGPRPPSNLLGFRLRGQVDRWHRPGLRPRSPVDSSMSQNLLTPPGYCGLLLMNTALLTAMLLGST